MDDGCPSCGERNVLAIDSDPPVYCCGCCGRRYPAEPGTP